MKNKILLAILAIALVFGMTACNENGGGGGNTDPKTIVITGIPAEKTGDVGLLIADDPSNFSFEKATAGGMGTISGGSVTIELGWNGSGSYYVSIRLLGDNVPYDYTNGTADWVKVSITKAVTTLSFDKFKVSGG